MRTFSTGFAASLASPVRKTRKGLIVTAQNGTVVRCCTSQKNKTIDGETYVPALGINLASVPLDINSGSRWDFVIVDSDLFAKADLRDGIWDDAAVQVFLYDEDDTGAPDDDMLFEGNVAQVEVTENGWAKISCEGILAQASAIVSALYSPICRFSLGDKAVKPEGQPGCPVDIYPFETSPWVHSATVVSGSGYTLTLTAPAVGTVDHYANGRVVFITGRYAGKTWPIRKNTSSTVYKLFRPLPAALGAGDDVWLIPGCDKTTGANGHRKFNDNLWMFGGEPYAARATKQDEGSVSGLRLVYAGANNPPGQVEGFVDANDQSFRITSSTTEETFNAHAVTQSIKQSTYAECTVLNFGFDEDGGGAVSFGFRIVEPGKEHTNYTENWARISLVKGESIANKYLRGASDGTVALDAPAAEGDVIAAWVEMDENRENIKVRFAINGNNVGGVFATWNEGDDAPHSEIRYEAALHRPGGSLRCAFELIDMTYPDEIPEGYVPGPLDESEGDE